MPPAGIRASSGGSGSTSPRRPGKGLVLFVSNDNLRKGAALNAVQIAELVADQLVPGGRAAVGEPERTESARGGRLAVLGAGVMGETCCPACCAPAGPPTRSWPPTAGPSGRWSWSPSYGITDDGEHRRRGRGRHGDLGRQAAGHGASCWPRSRECLRPGHAGGLPGCRGGHRLDRGARCPTASPWSG